jgi:hypothetical protein
LASFHGALIQTSYSSVVVRITGIAFGCADLCVRLTGQESVDVCGDLTFHRRGLCLEFSGPLLRGLHQRDCARSAPVSLERCRAGMVDCRLGCSSLQIAVGSRRCS